MNVLKPERIQCVKEGRLENRRRVTMDGFGKHHCYKVLNQKRHRDWRRETKPGSSTIGNGKEAPKQNEMREEETNEKTNQLTQFGV